ncbi:MAG TPA: hypothetical protein PLN54_00670, partial [Flavobacteriales bacterium]|nr:hypothetical protein [Flavobacteriales bacterium]
MSALRQTFSAVLVPLAFLFTMGPLQAAHYSGGSITYECLGGNMYQISLDVFLDCSGVAITSQDLTFTNSCGVSFTLTNIPQVSSEEVSQLCPGSLANSTCNGGALPGFTHYTFQTTLFLSPCNFWTIAWDICCRNDLQNVQGTPGIYLEATLNNAGGLCDQSPAFAENTIPFFCVNQPVNYNLGATDANGNTMVFSLVEGQTVSPLLGPLDYEPGYSGAEPIPGITIDPTSGQLSFTPTVTGNYAIVVEVATYNASGVLIGTVLRDVMIVVQNCNDPPPSTTGLNNANGGLITGASTIEVCDGIPFCVDLPFSDPDPATVITAVSNVTAQLPGATFTLSGTNPLVATICWTPDPAFSPANVLVTATDNACPIANVVSSSVFITVVQPPPTVPDAGISASVSSCSGGAAVNLFAQLGGTPDAGGIWTAPDGSSHSGLFTPGVDAFGVYTYVVGNACDNASATVTVSSAGGPNAGTNGTLTVCSNGAPVALIGQLGGTPDAGGTWSGPSPVVGGLYAPATMTPGIYTYTVTGVAPCANVTSTVTVTENAAPNAGTNGSLAFCGNSAALALATGLGGTPQAGGAWSGPSAVVAGQYNPATMAPGAYVYTVTGVAPCANSTATVTVTENPAPNAGTNGTLTLCSNGAAVALSTGLGGTPQAGGTWSGPSAVVGGQYNPATMAPGAYVYTVAGLAPCANATATVTVAETAAPNAGTNGTLTVCSNGASVALSTGLGGTPQAGGAWSGPSAVVGGQYDPTTMTPGAYTYTVTSVAPCTNATATVTVTENAATNAGTDGAITVCDNGAAIDLFAQLGGTPQGGGTWSGPSAVVGGQYDPATMTPGAYTYTVTGVAPCTNATATVTVTENAATNAGTDGSITVCDNGAAIDLFAQLGGTPQAGGAWSGPSAVVGG